MLVFLFCNLNAVILRNFHLDDMFADGIFQGLAFDWITGNLYIGARDGYVIVCDTSVTRSFLCLPLLTRQFDVDGIALNPTEGHIPLFLISSFNILG